MAIVGNKRWEKHLAHISSQFYAKESQYFENDSDAFDWINS